MSEKSTQIALGGLFSALCLVWMFLTGLIPFSTYILPALSGAMLIAVLEENGCRTAVLVYISTAVLSVFIVPDREAALMFAVFFGYYPITKQTMDRIPLRLLRWSVKLLLFNAAILGSYAGLIFLFGIQDMLYGADALGRYTVPILLGIGNGIFLLYDSLLQRYTFLYRYWFRRKFLRR